ncbi:MAG: sulfite exporter TauE/SafE family protein [Methylovirgula sp.]
MLTDPMTLQVGAVMVLATLIRSTFGFGEGLVAVPLLAFLMPVRAAAPLAALISITVAVIALIQDWSEVRGRSAGWLLLSTLFGIPLGLLLLTRAPQSIIKGALAVVIVTFSLYPLVMRRKIRLRDDRAAWLFGFSAGVLGGAYGMNGPPLAIYGTLRGWPPQHFRATLQGYFLPASVMGIAGYWLAGLWTSAVTRYYLISLPVMVAAVFIGRTINRRMHPSRFLFFVHTGLALVGVLLLFQALRG